MNSERDLILQSTIDTFKDTAIECHLFGSLARGNYDELSDIDIWFTFKDEDFEKIKEARFELYQKIGEVIVFCEPPQNAPINGICTSLKIKTNNSIVAVDLYLCPQSTSFTLEEGKKLFGIDIPVGKIEGYNPQKIEVPEDYRINFFLGFIFGTIKKLKRKVENPLNDALQQYENLGSKHNLPVDKVESPKQDLETLEKIILNTKKVANEKQKSALEDILNYVTKVI